jgi:hypothetical protein
MTVRRTRQGCTVTTTFGETKNELPGVPAGSLIEHVTMECTQVLDLRIVKPDKIKMWER